MRKTSRLMGSRRVPSRIPRRIVGILFIFVALTALSACQADVDSSDGANQTASDHRDWSDHDALFLIDRLPLGVRWEEARREIPGLGPIQRGEGALSHLQTAIAPAIVFGHSGSLELNFADEILYSYYFRIEPGCEEARHLTDMLRSTYTARYGRGIHEAEQESGYASDSSFWDADDADVALTLGRQDDRCRLAWGFQDHGSAVDHSL